MLQKNSQIYIQHPLKKKHPLKNFAKNIQKKQNAMMNKVRDIYSKYSNFERLDGKE